MALQKLERNLFFTPLIETPVTDYLSPDRAHSYSVIEKLFHCLPESQKFRDSDGSEVAFTVITGLSEEEYSKLNPDYDKYGNKTIELGVEIRVLHEGIRLGFFRQNNIRSWWPVQAQSTLLASGAVTTSDPQVILALQEMTRCSTFLADMVEKQRVRPCRPRELMRFSRTMTPLQEISAIGKQPSPPAPLSEYVGGQQSGPLHR